MITQNNDTDAIEGTLAQARRLIENDYQPIPVEYGSKRPSTAGWTELQIQAENMERYFPDDAPSNIGLLTHHMPVLDIDVLDAKLADELADEALRRWPGALRRVGEAPKVALFFCTDDPFRKLTTQKVEIDGKFHRIEVLCDGQQVVGFGRHPNTGEDYKWIGSSPLEIARIDLPRVTSGELEDFMTWAEILLKAAASEEVSAEAAISSNAGDDGATELSKLKRGLREHQTQRRRHDWESKPDPIKALERKRIIGLLNATEHNTLNYEDWIALGHAVKTVCGWDGYEAWVDFSAKYPKNTSEMIDNKWESFPDEGRAGVGTIICLLKKCGLSEEVVSSSARELSKTCRECAQEAASEATQPRGSISPTPFALPDEALIPKRDWLYGRFLIRRFLSLTVAPGGTGKSALTIVEALAMVTGTALLGDSVFRELRVWTWNGEDPQDELDRRFAAACKQYAIDGSDLGDRLMVDTGRKLPIKMATMDRAKGVVVAKPLVEELIAVLLEHDIDVLIIDPFATSHLVPENDNAAMNAVVDAWRQVADAANCAVHLVHHVNKGAALNADQGIYGSRGAGALIDGVRAARSLERMKKEDAAKLGLETHAGHFQVIDGKMNLAPPAQDARWFKIETVGIANGDDVGVCVRWEPPALTDSFTDGMILEVLEHLNGHPPLKKNEQAHEWIGYEIAIALDLDVGEPGSTKDGRLHEQNAERARVRALVSKLMKDELLEDQSVRNNRAGRETPALLLGEKALRRLQSEPAPSPTTLAAE